MRECVLTSLAHQHRPVEHIDRKQWRFMGDAASTRLSLQQPLRRAH